MQGELNLAKRRRRRRPPPDRPMIHSAVVGAGAYIDHDFMSSYLRMMMSCLLLRTLLNKISPPSVRVVVYAVVRFAS